MLLRAITAIRRKPRAVRQQYAFMTAVLFTAFVAGIWTLSVPARFVSVQQGVFTTTTPAASQPAAVPFSSVWNQLRQQVDTVVNTATPPTTPGALDVEVAGGNVPPQTPAPSSTIELESGSTITFGTSSQGLPATSTTILIRSATSTPETTSPAGD